MVDMVRPVNLMDRPMVDPNALPPGITAELREDGFIELREDGSFELRQ